MDRPVMHPDFAAPMAISPERSSIDWLRFARSAGAWAMKALTADLNPFVVRRRERRPVTLGHTVQSIARLLLFSPLLIALMCAAFVYIGTHPKVDGSRRDPLSVGIYFDPVSFSSEDGTRLEGWIVPVVNASRVLTERDAVLSHRYPAVVLVPDTGAPREQLLPFISALHDAGYILLAFNPRGLETGERAGSTFGINEAGDVCSAVNMLRRRPFVDPNRVGVLGIGSGANAARLAQHRDASINTLVLLSPQRGARDVIDQISPQQPWLGWMRPLCKWTFEIGYQLDLDELNAPIDPAAGSSAGTYSLAEHPYTDGLRHGRILEFLDSRLRTPTQTAKR
jgi:hypothetical protein